MRMTFRRPRTNDAPVGEPWKETREQRKKRLAESRRQQQLGREIFARQHALDQHLEAFVERHRLAALDIQERRANGIAVQPDELPLLNERLEQESKRVN